MTGFKEIWKNPPHAKTVSQKLIKMQGAPENQYFHKWYMNNSSAKKMHY